MAIFEEQIIFIKFCFKLKKSATETHELIKEAFGDAALSRSRTFEWFSRFLKGREKVNDDQHTGRPRSLRCEENKLKIKESNNLTEEFLLKTYLQRLDYLQWIEREEPKPKKARFTKSKVKTLLVTFFDINGLVHHEFIPFGRTINQEVYLGIMRRLREAVRLKRPESCKTMTGYFTSIPHPPYSPDLVPNDFLLYPKLKMKLKGRKFDNVDMIQAESEATLRNLSKTAQPADPTKWIQVALSVEHNRQQSKLRNLFKPKVCTLSQQERSASNCPFFCPICMKKRIKVKLG
ncbi:hypothetical protein LAZ67_X003306 [Cordylochernes scorpioides]|uniref:Mos1 transposase HTH domain-containing protein n=1 Tax=Cordylochernes scorpioides TaxID=51811 RepID=A0ABY6LU16_9ARAC|nr:hypothetical protein LAZ67_X003306 [Cordylochernes scorpioides]